MEVRTNLAQLRTKRGLGAAQLAAEIGISRQTIYAIEAGTYVPNTAVSLKLAKVLDTTVEELFQIEPEADSADKIINAIILGDIDFMAPGQPLRLCRVDGKTIAVVSESGGLGLSPSDALLLTPIRGAKRHSSAKVQVLGDEWRKPNRILISGCDPSASLLAHSLERQGFELVIAYENSSQALDLLHEGLVHVAGTHINENANGKKDLLPVTRMFSRNSIAVFSFAMWKEGLVMASGNPKKISGIEDLSRKDVLITNREPGAGCRRLLDDLLIKHGIAGAKIKGYDRITQGQLPAARLVQSGDVDCCISTQVSALTMGLDFLPLAEKPYLLVIRRSHLALPAVEAMLETLGRAAFRREVEACVGYDMRTAGNRII